MACDDIAWLKFRYAQHVTRLGRFAFEDLSQRVMLQLFVGLITRALRIENAVVWGVEAGEHSLRVLAEAGRIRQELIGQSLESGAEALALWIAHWPESRGVTDFFSQQAMDATGVDGQSLLRETAMPIAIEGQLSGVLLMRSSKSSRFEEMDQAFVASMTRVLALASIRRIATSVDSRASDAQMLRNASRGVAHQFNNMMTVVVGNLQLIAEEPSDSFPPHVREAIDHALVGSQRAVTLAAQFSLTASATNEVVKTVDASLLMRRIASVVRHASRHRIALKIESQAIYCSARLTTLRSVLIDLAMDAADSLTEDEDLVLVCNRIAVPSTVISGAPSGILREGVAFTVSIVSTHVREERPTRQRKGVFLTEADMRRSGGRSLPNLQSFAERTGGAVSTELHAGSRTLTLVLSAAACPHPSPPASEECS